MLAAASLRFYLDENIPVEIANQLRARSIDVVTVRELGLLGDSDINHLQRAAEMQRVLCPFDTDYIDLAVEGVQHAGIVLGQGEEHSIGDWVKWLELMHAVYTADEMVNTVEYVKVLS